MNMTPTERPRPIKDWDVVEVFIIRDPDDFLDCALDGLRFATSNAWETLAYVIKNIHSAEAFESFCNREEGYFTHMQGQAHRVARIEEEDTIAVVHRYIEGDNPLEGRCKIDLAMVYDPSTDYWWYINIPALRRWVRDELPHHPDLCALDCPYILDERSINP